MGSIRLLRPHAASESRSGAIRPERSYSGSAGTARFGQPLLVTADLALLDEVQRIAAATGVDLDIRPEAAGLQAEWGRASLIIIGSDAAGAVAALPLSRRQDVVLAAIEDVAAVATDNAIWRWAVAIGAEHVAFLPDGDAWLADRLADCAEERGTPGAVMCMVGGRGGAGASTLAAAVASRSAERGAATMLVDGDPLGGGVDLVVGCEGDQGTRWPALVATRGRVDATALVGALPHAGSLAVLACDRGGPAEIPSEAMAAVLSAAQRACDVVVVDLPRQIGPAAAEALGRSARTFIVVPAEVRATASAARVCAAVRLYASDVRAIVRRPAPSGLTAQVVADALGLRLAGDLRPEKGLERALDCGEAPGRSRRSPLGRLADQVLDELVFAAAVA